MRIRKRVFIGCEGESERSYVRWLQGRSDELGRSLHFDPHKIGGGDPLAVVEGSIKKLKVQTRRFGPYHTAAVLLDSDRLQQAPERDARIPKAAEGINLLYQIYDHEALLLRHFKKCGQRRPPSGKSHAALLKVWPEYRKGADAIALRGKLDLDALRRLLAVEPAFHAFFYPLLFG